MDFHSQQWMDTILKVVEERMRFINSHRTEIIEAFLAKHGCDPEDCVHCVQRMRDGGEKFWIRKMTPEEMELRDRNRMERSFDSSEL